MQSENRNPSRRVSGRVFAVLAIIAVCCALVWLYPKRDSTGPPPIDSENYQWFNPLSYTPPPATLNTSNFNTRDIKRLLDRLDWASSDVQNWTQRHLMQMGAGVSSAIAARLPGLLERRPLYATKLLDTLALVIEADEIDTLTPALSHSMDFVRIAAVKALSKVDSPESSERLAKISQSNDPAISRMATDSLLKRAARDGSYLAEYLESQVEAVESGIIDDGLVAAFFAAADNKATNVVPTIERLAETVPEAYKLEAARTLLFLGDANGIGKRIIEDSLRSETDIRRASSIAVETKTLPDLEILESIATNPIAEFRPMAAAIIGAALPPVGDERRNQSLRILDLLLDDTRGVVALAAKAALYKNGQTEIADEFIEKIETKSGSELRDSVQALAETFGDNRGCPAMLKRLADQGLGAIDRSHLLHGIAIYGTFESRGAFLDAIRRAGTDEDPVLTNSRLSLHAALKIQNLGSEVCDDLMAVILDRELNPKAHFLALDALRGLFPSSLGDQKDAAVDFLFGLIKDTSRQKAFRIGAVESLTFMNDLDMADKMMKVRETVADSDIRRVIDAILLNYF